MRLATSSSSQGKHRTLPLSLSSSDLPSHSVWRPSAFAPQNWADTAHGLLETPLCFWLVEEILNPPLQSTICYCSEQAGTCFQKAAGPGDHVSLLDTINWVMSQSCNEDKFWCLLQLSWEMHTHRPKSHRGRERQTDLLCLSGPHGHQINGQCQGTPLWTDLQFFCCSRRHLDVSPSPRVAH